MFARVCCFFLIALAGGYGSVWAEGSAWQASGPAGPGASVRAPSHPAEDGLYSRLKKMPYLYDNKDAEFLNQFKLLLTGQYQGGSGLPFRSQPVPQGLSWQGKRMAEAPDRV